MAEVPNQTMQEPAPYKVYGTNEPYNGLTVEVGGFLYTTVGGALEGDSLQLTANVQPRPTPPPNQNGNQTLGGAGLTTNPNQQQQNQLMGIGGQAGVNPNQDQQNQLMSGPGVNPNQDLQDTIAY